MSLVTTTAPKITEEAPPQVAQAPSIHRDIPAPPADGTITQPSVDKGKMDQFLNGIRGKVDELRPEMDVIRRKLFEEAGVAPQDIPDADK